MKKTTLRLPTMLLKASVGFAHRFRWASKREVEAEERLKLVDFLEDDESCIGGVKMRKRAMELGEPAGWIHAERMSEQQGAIPAKWRRGRNVLVFAGTLKYQAWKYPHVACLRWNGKRWEKYFVWLGQRFDRGCLLVLLDS